VSSSNAFYARYKAGQPLFYVGTGQGTSLALETQARQLSLQHPAARSIHLMVNGRETYIFRP